MLKKLLSRYQVQCREALWKNGCDSCFLSPCSSEWWRPAAARSREAVVWTWWLCPGWLSAVSTSSWHILGSVLMYSVKSPCDSRSGSSFRFSAVSIQGNYRDPRLDRPLSLAFCLCRISAANNTSRCCFCRSRRRSIPSAVASIRGWYIRSMCYLHTHWFRNEVASQSTREYIATTTGLWKSQLVAPPVAKSQD